MLQAFMCRWNIRRWHYYEGPICSFLPSCSLTFYLIPQNFKFSKTSRWRLWEPHLQHVFIPNLSLMRDLNNDDHIVTDIELYLPVLRVGRVAWWFNLWLVICRDRISRWEQCVQGFMVTPPVIARLHYVLICTCIICTKSYLCIIYVKSVDSITW